MEIYAFQLARRSETSLAFEATLFRSLFVVGSGRTKASTCGVIHIKRDFLEISHREWSARHLLPALGGGNASFSMQTSAHHH